ncbi:hypothetical protein [Virgibacillus halodenitrificans]|uniref:hypothetical protein n=1 Tax=Virgibacillus halodenitrificans TaxID=1482 RepID=UPI001677FF56|nr:hypothetical protein [Virgibacillus halodenitrificans]
MKEKHEDSSERKNIFPSCDAQFAEAFLVLWEKQQGFLMGRVIAKDLRWDEVTQSQPQLKIPQDPKSFYEKHRTQKKWVSFSRKWFSSEEAEALPTESEVSFPKRPIKVLSSYFAVYIFCESFDTSSTYFRSIKRASKNCRAYVCRQFSFFII